MKLLIKVANKSTHLIGLLLIVAASGVTSSYSPLFFGGIKQPKCLTK